MAIIDDVIVGVRPNARRRRRRLAHPWIRFLARRLIGMAFVLLALVVGVFLMVQLVPGDPVLNSLGLDAATDQIDRLRAQLGLDQPLLTQFWDYFTGLLQGDLGTSFQTQQPVSQLISERIGTSLELAGSALVIVLAGSIPLGLVAAALTRESRHPRLETLFTGTTSVLGAIPDYLTGTILAFIFAVQLNWLPVAGTGGVSTLILPALAVSIAPLATLSRIVRVETLNVLAQDYVRTARGKRLRPARILFRHVLPNVLTAALTVGGLIFAGIIGGAVVVENVFARPGVGTALVEAVLAKDYPVIQGITLMLGITVVVVNALVDVLIAVIDPRSLTRES